MRDEENPFEALVEATANALVDMVKSIPEAAKPFGAVRLSDREVLERYRAHRDDPAYWQAIIQEQGPQEAVRYWQKMQEMEAKYATRRGRSAVLATATDAGGSGEGQPGLQGY